MRIRCRLLVLILAVLIPAVMTAALGIWQVYQEQQRALRQSLRETTHALAQVIDKEIANREILLRTLATAPALEQGDYQAFYEHARAAVASWGGTIILSDLAGHQFLNTRLPYGEKNLPQMPLLVRLRQEFGPDAKLVSDIYFAPSAQQYSYSLQMPVRHNGRIVMYISISSFVSQLQDVLDAQKLPQEWRVNISDRKGNVIARSHEPARYLGKYIGDERFRKMAGKLEGFHESQTFQGMPTIAFYSRVPSSGWAFLVAVPKHILYDSVFKVVALTGSLMLVLLVLAVLSALALGRNIAQSIEALGNSAEQLGQGLPITAQRFGTKEMDAVSAVMAHASTEIHSARKDLEKRVAAAVATAEQSQRALLQAQKLEALGRLTGGIAHDFNNVLQSLTTGLQLMQLSATEGREKKLLETCQRAVGRGVELARQLMVFGRVQDARLVTVDMRQQIEFALPMLNGALPENIQFDATLQEQLWPVTLDPLQFELALLNVTMNARDAMPSGGRLTLTAQNQSLPEPQGDLPAGDYVYCRVVDSGAGMAQEVLSTALDPFFTTKAVGKGSGMGLPQAYGFARQAGGTLVLNSRVGEGTEVVIFLPRSNLPFSSPVGAVSRAASGASLHGKLLFVEDDALVRDAVRPALETAGFQVTVAANGEEAIGLLDAGGQFDLAFSDVVMPGKINGIELAYLLRQRNPDMGIVLATGYSERRIGVPGVRVLAKPYELNDLLQALTENKLGGRVHNARTDDG